MRVPSVELRRRGGSTYSRAILGPILVRDTLAEVSN